MCLCARERERALTVVVRWCTFQRQCRAFADSQFFSNDALRKLPWFGLSDTAALFGVPGESLIYRLPPQEWRVGRADQTEIRRVVGSLGRVCFPAFLWCLVSLATGNAKLCLWFPAVKRKTKIEIEVVIILFLPVRCIVLGIFVIRC